MAFTSSLTFLCRISTSSTLQLEGIFQFVDKESVSLTLTLNQTTIKKTSSSVQIMSSLKGWLEDVML